MALERQDEQQHKHLALIFKEDTPRDKQRKGQHLEIWSFNQVNKFNHFYHKY